LKKEVFIGTLRPHFPKRTDFCVRKTPAAQTGISSESGDIGFRRPTGPDTASSLAMTPKTADAVPSGGATSLDHMPHNQENATRKRRIFSYEV